MNDSSDLTDHAPKKPADWFQNGFHRFLRPYLRRHFHAVAIESQSRQDLELSPNDSLIVYANHPSWWDPLIAHFLNRTLFPGRQFYAPIDAEALEQYQVFEKLGFFGVKLSSQSGAAAFLKVSNAVLDQKATALWLTPEGRFADARDHEAELMPGLAHLCDRRDDVVALPIALEYVFWNERLPVCLVNFGQPHRSAEHPEWSKQQRGQHLAESLRAAQARLAKLSVERSSEPFDNLLRGRSGGGGVYDSFRRMKSMLTGKRFQASHGDQFE